MRFMNQQFRWIKFPNFNHPDFEETQFTVVQTGLLGQILNQLQGKTTGIVRFTGCRGIDIDRALVELTSYIRHAHIEHTSSKGRTYVVQGSYRVTLVNSLIFPNSVLGRKEKEKETEKENPLGERKMERQTSEPSPSSEPVPPSSSFPGGSSSSNAKPDVRAQELKPYLASIEEWDERTGQDSNKNLAVLNMFRKWVRESGKSEQDVRDLILSSLSHISELPGSKIPDIGFWFKDGLHEKSMTDLMHKFRTKKTGQKPAETDFSNVIAWGVPVINTDNISNSEPEQEKQIDLDKVMEGL